MSNLFSFYGNKNRIIHEIIPPYSPEYNRVAERKNRILKEKMNYLLINLGAPMNLWGESILTACYIQNRISYKKIRITPYKLWKGYAPNLLYLKVWECFAKDLILDPKRKRIWPEKIDCKFIGYAQNSTIYRFLVLENTMGLFDANNIIEFKSTDFFEYIFPKEGNR